jgi:hypothetical protein
MLATTPLSVGSLVFKIELEVDVIGALKCRSELAEFPKANFPMIPRLYLAVVFWIKGDYFVPLQPVVTGGELTVGKVVSNIRVERSPAAAGLPAASTQTHQRRCMGD